jgi:hypothetical protein
MKKHLLGAKQTYNGGNKNRRLKRSHHNERTTFIPIDLLLTECSLSCCVRCKQVSTSQIKDCDHTSKSFGFPMQWDFRVWTISSSAYEEYKMTITKKQNQQFVG